VRLAGSLLVAVCCGGQSVGIDGGAGVDAAGSDVTINDVATDVVDGAPDAALASRCVVDASGVTCQSQALMLSDSVEQRTVTWERPLGVAPTGGWPAVIYFQGSFIPGHTAFAAVPGAAFGMYQMTLTIKALLDGGYTVISPDAISNGSTYWQTNIPPYATNWPGCRDDVLMQAIFASMAKGDFGPVDSSHLYAMGISSGGFMTSRMAVSYAGKFRALADCSGSYATCGPTCVVPTPLPSNHPPIIFLHGDMDNIVPMSAVQPSLDDLNNVGHVTKLVTDPNAGHEWLTAGPTAILAWFAAH
jgi:poly(3-hydroxybutyrate) depolymerase